MSDIAVRVEGLGKEYKIGGKQEAYGNLRDTISSAFTAPFKKASSLLRGQAYGAAGLSESIWALKDVSFEIKKGEVVGIIGRNGAGKSTLLKVLSRITEPTEGYADIYGRVGALLEVGTGFHPELTGRENIYLNAAILGMTRREIEQKFDEIVDFAEVEKFIDTPVKYYSSGMGLRLGFSVAAHMEPEILVVDEVLAVGDIEFQKKCLGRMSAVASEGRTVLFVSHNMGAVANLCSRSIWLVDGNVQEIGDTRQIIQNYLTISTKSGHTVELTNYINRIGTGEVRFSHVWLQQGQKRVDSVDMGADIEICFQLNFQQAAKVHLSLNISTTTGVRTLHVADAEDSFMLHGKAEQTYTVRVNLTKIRLYPGQYTVSLWCSDLMGQAYDSVQNCIEFSVIQSSFVQTAYNLGWQHGLFLHTAAWELEE